MPEQMQPLTVRFSQHVLDELADRAKTESKNVSDVVRQIVDDALSEIDRTEDVLVQIKDVHRSVDLLREALADVALAILTRLEPDNLKKTERWVEETILKAH